MDTNNMYYNATITYNTVGNFQQLITLHACNLVKKYRTILSRWKILDSIIYITS